MRIFYGQENGIAIASVKPSLKDITNLFGKLFPKKVVLEDTRQVAITDGFFGNHLSEAYYTFRGYSVWRI